MDLETFRKQAAQGQEGWDSGYGEDRLVLGLARTWRLGPEPGGIAVWTLPDFASLGAIAAALNGVHEPVELVTAGIYADFGNEIL